jgi:hypothetical protein
MTKKKQRTKLARILRQQGIKGAQGFRVAKALVAAGGFAGLPANVQTQLNLWVVPGGFCPLRMKVVPTQAHCLTTGACLRTAWGRLWGIRV